MTLLHPKISNLQLAAISVVTALFLCSDPLNQIRAQAWLDNHGQKLPEVSAEIRSHWSSTDREIYEILHPAPRPGLVGAGGLSDRHLILCNRLLHLAESSSGDEFRDTIFSRVAKLRLKGVPDSRYEAQQVLGMAEPVDNDLFMTRLFFLDSSLATYISTDIRLGTHCAGFEWNSPFRLLAEQTLAFNTRSKMIDDLTFNLL
ncbi:hypothetical protein BH11CYA1_BH11CYA1_08230 [soil metagenome]